MVARYDATLAELAEMTGLSTSTVSRRIRDLKGSGRIRCEGSRVKGRWVVVRRCRTPPSDPAADDRHGPLPRCPGSGSQM